MKVQHSAAVSLLVALGAAMAGKWTMPKLLGKLKKIDELVDGGTTLAEDDDALLKALRKANEAEEDIEIEEDSDKPAKKDKKKAKAEKDDDEDDEKLSKKDKDKKKAKGKRPTTAAAPDAPRDQFGNREGTQAAAINAVMTKKSQEVSEIAEASGFSNARVKGHLAFLVEHGFAEKTSKGYKLTGKTKKSAAKDKDEDAPERTKPAKDKKKTKKVKPEADEGGDEEGEDDDE